MVDPTNPENPEGDAPRRGATRRARKKKAVVDGGRKQKELTYRGYAKEELKSLPDAEVLQILPSRARRFMRRGLGEVEKTFLSKVIEAGEGEEVRTHLRDFPILPSFIGKTIQVYSGKDWNKVVVTTEMIGHKLGEFSQTRRFGAHTGPGVGATRSSKFMPLK
ncbi:MAG TPA: 30S ribosomal protein S19 [Candidatus Thermoplasmatota archaeon]|nr:30S ribosomal protein S19 [Candidatus Thermoplasmatota archaeon]